MQCLGRPAARFDDESRGHRRRSFGRGPGHPARASGARVTLFDDGRRPELLVGESLVPAVVPILQRLGLEEETASFSRVKPGVSFIWSPNDRFSSPSRASRRAYTPTPTTSRARRFDDAVLARAVASGVERVVAHARMEPITDEGRELGLAPETLAAAPSLGGRQPDLVVDATGRARLGARALNIGAHYGPRKDVAHFAHFENFAWDDEPGQVLIRRLDAGWSWCIRSASVSRSVSCWGATTPRGSARARPSGSKRAIATDPWLSTIGRDSKRVTSVATYANYQLISHRGLGPAG